MKAILTGVIVAVLTVGTSWAQLERVRASPDGPVDEVFWAPTFVVLPSVANMPSGNLNFSIQHAFGLVSDGVDDLFGLDGSANVRFGLDYGVTDNISVGFGRSRFDKVYDGRMKWNILRQTKDGRMPVELAVATGAGLTTLKNGFDLDERLSYHAAVLLARKFTNTLSLQVSPLVSHMNVVYRDFDRFGNVVEQKNTHWAIGVSGRYVLHPQVSLSVEYLPVIGDRSDGTVDVLSLLLNLDTGGHVFQLFFTSSEWITLQHAVARNSVRFLEGDFRWGFNVNRVF